MEKGKSKRSDEGVGSLGWGCGLKIERTEEDGKKLKVTTQIEVKGYIRFFQLRRKIKKLQKFGIFLTAISVVLMIIRLIFK